MSRSDTVAVVRRDNRLVHTKSSTKSHASTMKARRRPNAPQACDLCRSRKTRCDRKAHQNSCQHCRKFDLPCSLEQCDARKAMVVEEDDKSQQQNVNIITSNDAGHLSGTAVVESESFDVETHSSVVDGFAPAASVPGDSLAVVDSMQWHLEEVVVDQENHWAGGADRVSCEEIQSECVEPNSSAAAIHYICDGEDDGLISETTRTADSLDTSVFEAISNHLPPLKPCPIGSVPSSKTLSLDNPTTAGSSLVQEPTAFVLDGDFPFPDPLLTPELLQNDSGVHTTSLHATEEWNAAQLEMLQQDPLAWMSMSSSPLLGCQFSNDMHTTLYPTSRQTYPVPQTSALDYTGQTASPHVPEPPTYHTTHPFWPDSQPFMWEYPSIPTHKTYPSFPNDDSYYHTSPLPTPTMNNLYSSPPISLPRWYPWHYQGVYNGSMDRAPCACCNQLGMQGMAYYQGMAYHQSASHYQSMSGCNFVPSRMLYDTYGCPQNSGFSF